MTKDSQLPSRFRLIDREHAFHGRRLDVYVDQIEDSDGRRTVREIVHHPGAVAIVPMLSTGSVLLVRQDRPAAGDALWELPAGTLEPDEARLHCAQRELIEETGYSAAIWHEIVSFFTTPGISNERITLYRADDLSCVGEPDSAEITTCQAFSPDELMTMVDEGHICDAKTLIGLLWVGILSEKEEDPRT